MKHPRMIRHEIAFSHMRAANFGLAIVELKGSLSEYGPNLLSLIDLAASYHGLGDYQNFQKHTNFAFNEYERCFDLLSRKSKYHASLGLGRVLEDAGKIADAVKVYSNYLGLDSTENELTARRKIESELLRVYAMLGDKEKTANLYLRITKELSAQDAAKPDIVHSLILAEYEFVGLQTAFKRFIDNKDSLTRPEKRLIYFDFLYELTREDDLEQVNETFFEDLTYLECDPFERAVWDVFLVLKGQEPQASLEPERADQMSPICSLRYLHLLAKFQLLQDRTQEINNKLNLFFLALDPISRRLVQKFIASQGEENITVVISADTISDTSGVKYSISGQKKIFQLLHYVLCQKKSSVEELSEILFDLEYSESTEARLRALISRINKIFEVQFRTSKLFSLKERMIVVNQSLQVRFEN